ncbi:MAG: LacI family DNA-binding transcriptional regulator [Lachnospiraceae bacterium]|nr:LacI family DNA-binding transcriptional regulator [Lachnospiraceae bacterium]
MATMKEIAELAGVSRGTVDRVLNKRGAVNAKTEEKILEIARALDYRPNKAGIALAAQKRKYKFGIIMFGIGNPFFDDVCAAFTEATNELSEYNCSVLVRRTSAFGVEDQLDAIDDLVEKGINGLVIAPQNNQAIADKINELWEAGIPTVTFNTDVPGCKRLCYVGSNYHKCGQTAAGLMNLFCNGDARVGIVNGSKQILCHTERIAGFCDRLKEYPGLSIVDSIENNDDDFKSYDLTKEMIDKHPEINALYFAAGGTYGGCKAVIAAGRDKDIKIVTFDKIATTVEMMRLGVISATICQQPEVQGALPLKILFDYLTIGEKPATDHVYTQTEIRICENID